MINLIDNFLSDSQIFVFVHGGYWHLDFDKTNSAYVVEPLYKAGIKVVVLDYDLCPKVTLEQLVIFIFNFDAIIVIMAIISIYFPIENRWIRFNVPAFR